MHVRIYNYMHVQLTNYDYIIFISGVLFFRCQQNFLDTATLSKLNKADQDFFLTSLCSNFASGLLSTQKQSELKTSVGSWDIGSSYSQASQ